MSIPKEMIILIGALVIAGVVPAVTLSPLEKAPQQPTSHELRRSTPPTGELSAAAADTLVHAVRGGEIFIIDLPEELDGRAIELYSLLQAPALSWLVDYSFMWRTLPQDAGAHDVLIHAYGPDVTDTLVVTVIVR